MEPLPVTDSSDAQSSNMCKLIPPTLRENESYHVFLSYSSTDYSWTLSLVDVLEGAGLSVCYHERDFTPGRTILENMSECITQSQKVLLVLSAEFVRSRWCLLEANMSLFRDCLERKPMVPVLLDQDVCVPLHLCHLTYIEARHPDFINKLLHVLCTPNSDLRGSSVVPYQPPSVYNGKALLPLTAANEDSLNSWDAGVYSEMDVPDQLRLIVRDQSTYRAAMAIINQVSQTQVWLRPLWKRVVAYIAGLCFWKYDDRRRILLEMQKAVGKANVLMFAQKVLMGCRSTSKIYLVYISLDSCRQEFEKQFSAQTSSEDMFRRALLYFSSGYTCCLAKKHFPFTTAPPSGSSGHLPGGVCFCHYVSQMLERGQWLDQ
uniref:TIR domain-containing protein n=1 Tax=Knipowitschia caucasica TaxID=637954 RepID=A0AAV2L257_KNICA